MSQDVIRAIETAIEKGEIKTALEMMEDNTKIVPKDLVEWLSKVKPFDEFEERVEKLLNLYKSPQERLKDYEHVLQLNSKGIFDLVSGEQIDLVRLGIMLWEEYEKYPQTTDEPTAFLNALLKWLIDNELNKNYAGSKNLWEQDILKELQLRGIKLAKQLKLQLWRAVVEFECEAFRREIVGVAFYHNFVECFWCDEGGAIGFETIVEYIDATKEELEIIDKELGSWCWEHSNVFCYTGEHYEKLGAQYEYDDLEQDDEAYCNDLIDRGRNLACWIKERLPEHVAFAISSCYGRGRENARLRKNERFRI